MPPRAAAMVLIMIMTLLGGPAYGDLRQDGEQAVHAYNCHNLYYDYDKSQAILVPHDKP